MVEYMAWWTVVMVFVLTLLVALIPAFIAMRFNHPYLIHIRIACVLAWFAWAATAISPLSVIVWGVAWWYLLFKNKGAHV